MNGELLDRYWSQIHAEPNTGCWLWIGSLRTGYGRIKVNGKTNVAHRLSYEHFKGPIPAGLQIDCGQGDQPKGPMALGDGLAPEEQS